MQETDTVLPFQLEESDIKGRLGVVSNSVTEILRNKNYPAVICKIVAEACVLTSLIGQSMDLRWKLSLQIRGKGPLKLIATDYFNFGSNDDNFRIRCHSSFDKKHIPSFNQEFKELIGEGYFAIIIDEGAGKEPYQGITPLRGDSLTECAENFFHQSEQLPTRFSIKIHEENIDSDKQIVKAGGIMLQYLAKGSEALKKEDQMGNEDFSSADFLSGNASENWKRVNLFLDTLGSDEFFDPKISDEALIYRLFNEEKPTVFEKRRIQFGCTCSPDKVRQTMSIYSSSDIKKMTNEAGKVTAECQFCEAFYSFDPEDLGMDSN